MAEAKRIAEQEARIAELQALVAELASERARKVLAEYLDRGNGHPSDLQRLKRDMEPVERARKALGGFDG